MVTLSCHPVIIEKGRHKKLRITTTRRICPFCQVIEDETHCITSCIKYEDEWTPPPPLQEMQWNFDTFSHHDKGNEIRFYSVKRRQEYYIQIRVLQYNCLKKREREISKLSWYLPYRGTMSPSYTFIYIVMWCISLSFVSTVDMSHKLLSRKLSIVL